VRILDIRRAEEVSEVEELSFPRYGLVRSDYMILKGSVLGPAKRLIRMRHTLRPTITELPPPQILGIERSR
jgi:large subunit ribosomal protein L3